MTDKVYLILDIIPGELEEAARIMALQAGVKTVEILEGPPDIIATLEAAGRQKLAECVNSTLGTIEELVESVKLLPVKNASNKRVIRLLTVK